LEGVFNRCLLGFWGCGFGVDISRKSWIIHGDCQGARSSVRCVMSSCQRKFGQRSVCFLSSFFSFLFFFFFCSSPAAAAITAAAITAAAAAAAVAAVTVTAAAAAAAAVTVAAAAAAAADFFVALFCLVWPFSRLFSSPLFYAVR